MYVYMYACLYVGMHLFMHGVHADLCISNIS
jgi:hypothetical protein